MGSSKYSSTRKNTQRYYTTKRLIRYIYYYYYCFKKSRSYIVNLSLFKNLLIKFIIALIFLLLLLLLSLSLLLLLLYFREQGWPPTNVSRVQFQPCVICGLSFLLVLVLAPRFFSGFSGFPPSTKTLQIPMWGPAWKPAKADVASSLNIVIYFYFYFYYCNKFCHFPFTIFRYFLDLSDY